ncbi:hypothetical protein ZIOFF_030767 [Zingiber officinale]|uniref:Uncharacterized protein n=1 Tax=Zingiber officinale TaxID=94328 RepID=A0A8J5GPX2_ZINOF|nr:hypothetical protein ZIOFF_030767 [Zingiber officinale]
MPSGRMHRLCFTPSHDFIALVNTKCQSAHLVLDYDLASLAPRTSPSIRPVFVQRLRFFGTMDKSICPPSPWLHFFGHVPKSVCTPSAQPTTPFLWYHRQVHLSAPLAPRISPSARTSDKSICMFPCCLACPAHMPCSPDCQVYHMHDLGFGSTSCTTVSATLAYLVHKSCPDHCQVFLMLDGLLSPPLVNLDLGSVLHTANLLLGMTCAHAMSVGLPSPSPVDLGLHCQSIAWHGLRSCHACWFVKSSSCGLGLG